MNMAATPRRMTFEEFLELPKDERDYELDNGVLVKRHSSNLSAAVGSRLSARLGSYCESKNLGEVFGPSTVYRCFSENRNTARKPSVSFVAQGRLPSDWLEQDYLTIAPDLAVDVVSSDACAGELGAELVKYHVATLHQYFDAGVKLVWRIFAGYCVQIYRANGSAAYLRRWDQLSGEDVVPGFTCPIADLFPPSAQVTS